MTKVGAGVSVWRGDTLVFRNVRYMGDITARTKLWFAVKSDHTHVDSASMIFVEETAGLEYINATAATVPANGVLFVSDASLGLVSVTVAAVEMATLPRGRWYYEIQVLRPTGVETLLRGDFTLVADVTRAVV